MDTNFKNIGLISKPDTEATMPTVQVLYDLLIQLGLNVIVDEETASHINSKTIDVISIEEFGTSCDLVMSIGGDGTLLSAARCLVNTNVPLIGINLGRLGFLVDISPDDLEQSIRAILNGQYRVEKRLILNVQVQKNGEVIHESSAFNEVAIHRLHSPGLIDIETSVDGRLLNSQRSDGLIVATPTGSTAYALSGGGPLMQPTLNALVLVPINPHTLSNRPIVIDGESEVSIKFSQRDQHRAQVTCDNVILPTVNENEVIVIKRFEKRISLLHPDDHDFFNILRVKLDWSRPPRS